MNGKHRRVSCHCGLATVAKQVLVEDHIQKLHDALQPAPDGKPWLEHVLRNNPDLANRLRKALNP